MVSGNENTCSANQVTQGVGCNVAPALNTEQATADKKAEQHTTACGWMLT